MSTYKTSILWIHFASMKGNLVQLDDAEQCFRRRRMVLMLDNVSDAEEWVGRSSVGGEAGHGEQTPV